MKPIFRNSQRARDEQARRLAERQRELGRRPDQAGTKAVCCSISQTRMLCAKRLRGEVASNVIIQVSRRLQQPVNFELKKFERHYETRLALPYPLVENLDPTNIARFEEQSTSPLGVDLDVQSTRSLPPSLHGGPSPGLASTATTTPPKARRPGFLIACRTIAESSESNTHSIKNSAAPPASKSVLVNNVGYRQTEECLESGRGGAQRDHDD
jgi:hypothetical protein